MATATPATPPAASQLPRELRIVSHSNLFYWWPVWTIGFIMGFVSWFSGFQLAAVPNETFKAKIISGEIKVSKLETGSDGNEVVVGDSLNIGTDRYILVAPEKTGKSMDPPHIFVTAYRGPGVIFCTVLMLVILITNIHLRGLWSLIVIVILVALIIILSLIPGAWDRIFDNLRILDIRISTGGYFLISGILFILWLVIFFFFDPQVYMVFTPGQFRIRLEIGEGETAYDTRGMTVHKVRSDFFRHWVLGLGSGDLIVKTTGAQVHEFNLSNVLFVSRKVKVIEDMVSAAGR